MKDRLDIILFGATGFTGKHCIPYLEKYTKKSNGRNFTWGIAGRSEEKLKAVLKEMGDKIETNLDSIPIIIADVSNDESLLNMAKRTKLVLNCCGPYRLFGEQVVKACIEAGTHHLDVSGEPYYMESAQMNYYDTAEQKGVYVVSACGMDSIPADLGIVYLQQNFEGTLNSVESYLRIWCDKPINKGPIVNTGTWQSIVHAVTNVNEMNELRKKYFQKFKKHPTYPPEVRLKKIPHKPKMGDGWAIPFPAADPSVIRRTQCYLYEHDNIRPIQLGAYFVIPSALVLVIFFFYSIIVLLLAQFKFGRKLLLNYPERFSAGAFSNKNPSEEIVDNSWFSVEFYAEGWKEKLANKDDQYTTKVDTAIKARVKGRNPGYGSTCLCLVLAGIVVLTETDKLPNNGKGGVYPPGAAFAKTTLVKQLNENGLTFEILSQNEINKSK